MTYSMRVAICLLALVVTLNATQTFSFFSADRNRTYVVESTQLGNIINFAGHWMYEPSLILPSAETGNLYTLLFNSNMVAYQSLNGGTAVFMAQSSTATSGYTAPTVILSNTWVSNICDMAAVRAIYDGSLWHVYVQAVEGNYLYPCTYGGTNPASIFKATGTTLTSLAWVKIPGTTSAQKILYTSLPGVGIGQDFSFFYSGPNGGDPSQAIQATYNDWGYVSGAQVFSYLSPNGATSFNYWYNIGPAYRPSSGNYTDGSTFPDVILKGTLDETSKGNPSIGAAYGCYQAGALKNLYQYSRGIGFYADPTPYPGRVPTGGIHVNGTLESSSSDGNGHRMFTPNFSRNSQGYLVADPVQSTSTKKVWLGYVVYNPNQINRHTTEACDQYYNWNSPSQGFAISSIRIEEQ